jgi:hypothetical protein
VATITETETGTVVFTAEEIAAFPPGPVSPAADAKKVVTDLGG